MSCSEGMGSHPCQHVNSVQRGPRYIRANSLVPSSYSRPSDNKESRVLSAAETGKQRNQLTTRLSTVLRLLKFLSFLSACSSALSLSRRQERERICRTSRVSQLDTDATELREPEQGRHALLQL